MKEKQSGSPHWTCECGHEERCWSTDGRITQGKGLFVFRRQPCGNCRRPMQLVSGETATASPAQSGG